MNAELALAAVNSYSIKVKVLHNLLQLVPRKVSMFCSNQTAIVPQAFWALSCSSAYSVSEASTLTQHLCSAVLSLAFSTIHSPPVETTAAFSADASWKGLLGPKPDKDKHRTKHFEASVPAAENSCSMGTVTVSSQDDDRASKALA
jgi:hypothetical protein